MPDSALGSSQLEVSPKARPSQLIAEAALSYFGIDRGRFFNYFLASGEKSVIEENYTARASSCLVEEMRNAE